MRTLSLPRDLQIMFLGIRAREIELNRAQSELAADQTYVLERIAQAAGITPDQIGVKFRLNLHPFSLVEDCTADVDPAENDDSR